MKLVLLGLCFLAAGCWSKKPSPMLDLSAQDFTKIEVKKDSCPQRVVHTEAEWKKTYDVYNEKYFNNKLPPARVTTDHSIDSMGDSGYSDWDYLGYPTIQLSDDTTLNDRYAHFVLLHEMVHIKLKKYYDNFRKMKFDGNDSHDSEFQKSMLELAKKGAFEGLW